MIHQLFIDFIKTYYSVRTEVNTLIVFGRHMKLVTLNKCVQVKPTVKCAWVTLMFYLFRMVWNKEILY